MGQDALLDKNFKPSLIAEDHDNAGEIMRLIARGRALAIVPSPLILALQDVGTNNKYSWGTGFRYTLMPNPSPSDLENSSLDAIEKTNISGTESVQLDEVFVFADLEHYYPVPTEGYVRTVLQVGAARGGTTAGTTYLTKAILDLGYIDTGGTFTSESSGNALINLKTTSTSYQSKSVQAWLSHSFEIPSGKKFALRVRLCAKMETANDGKIKLYLSRGSFDSYIEF